MTACAAFDALTCGTAAQSITANSWPPALNGKMQRVDNLMHDIPQRGLALALHRYFRASIDEDTNMRTTKTLIASLAMGCLLSTGAAFAQSTASGSTASPTSSNSMQKDSMSSDSMKKSGTTSMKHKKPTKSSSTGTDSMKNGSMKSDSMKSDSMNGDSMKNGSMKGGDSMGSPASGSSSH